MRFLVIGLGSMGKRRIRNLRSLGFQEVFGFDPRADRRAEAAGKYGIVTCGNIDQALEKSTPDALIISTPPDRHMEYAWLAAERSLHAFIEASVVEKDKIKKLARRLEEQPGLVIVPSFTMHFSYGPVKIREIVSSGIIGKPLFFNYHTGQYLPDWHPWESIHEFYVSKRETGGARELVPFELVWLNEIFGEPEPLYCVRKKLTDIDADIDDYYQMTLRYPGEVLASVVIEVISRPCAVQALRITGSEGSIFFNGDTNSISYCSLKQEGWTSVTLERGTVEQDYISAEEPYIEELRTFVEAVQKKDRAIFPNDLSKDAKLLDLLEMLEILSEEGNRSCSTSTLKG